jgi:hypothetical protein
VGDFPADLQTPTTMLLYTDMVKGSVLGDQFAPLLKLIPTEQGSRDAAVATYECRHLDFVNIASEHIVSINFSLRRFDGELVQFKDEDAEVLYNLVFRKIKRKRAR